MPSVHPARRSRFLVAGLLATVACLGVARAEDDGKLRDQALELNNVTGDDPIRGKVRDLVKDADASKKLLAVAVKMTKEKEQPFNYNAALILAEAARQLHDQESSKILYRVCIDQANALRSGTKLGQAYGGLLSILYSARKYDEAVKLCQEVLELPDGDDNLDNLKGRVQEIMIQALAKAGKFEEAEKLVDNLIKANKDLWLLLEVKAQVLREAGRYDDAVKVYEQYLERIKNAKELKEEARKELDAEARYALSGVYVELNQIDKADDQLKKLLDEYPDNPTFNNDLGYIWADHDMYLEESEKLVRKALEQERKQTIKNQPDVKPEDLKENAAYLDSLGWVLFKQKKYKEAKEYLEKATQGGPEGQHIEIFDHLGDTLLKLGQKAEAVATWKKGLELPLNGKRDQQRKGEVEKKVKENQ
jgi:pentatricopeptide repeat protein